MGAGAGGGAGLKQWTRISREAQKQELLPQSDAFGAKGHVEPGEGVIEAALREASEESGLLVQPGDPLGEISYIYSWRDKPGETAVRISKRVHFYLMQAHGGDTSMHDGEIDEVKWMPLDEALRRASHKSERELILKARRMLGAESPAR
ncbi:MAG: NUDIX domain-containing protein [Candidatus Binataceae bacterium]